MQLWKAGDVRPVNDYLDQRKGLPNQSLPFSQVQARPPVPSRSRTEITGEHCLELLARLRAR
jgi:hypothetical protein